MPAIAAPPALHHAAATLQAEGGAIMRVDVRLPRGYRIVVHDPARLHSSLEFEIRRGRAQYGVLTFYPSQPAGSTSPPDPAYPTPRETPEGVARSYRRPGEQHVRRVAPDRYLLLRGTRPVSVFVPLLGPVPTVVVGVGVGRSLLEAVARTMVVRLVAPRPLTKPSDPAALELLNRANRAISAQDAYRYTEGPPSLGEGTVAVIRSARYRANFWAGCWKSNPSVDPKQFLAPRLPIAATGLSYRPIEHVEGLLRLRYRYWTATAAPLTGQVDIDPKTLLPVHSRVAMPGDTRSFTFTRDWTWQPAAPQPIC